MSQRRNTHQEGSLLKTAAVFVAGAAAGALAAWLTSDSESNTNQPHQQQRPAINNAPATVRPTNTTTPSEDDEKKDGVLQCCEICFLPFEEIKAHDGQIMATPCGHVFCRCCITESLKNKRECPNCRTPIQLDDLNRLYI